MTLPQTINSLQMTVEKVAGKMTAIATDETLDRSGEVLDIKKWDLKNFKRNPVLQAGHSNMPQNTIGIAKNIKVDRQGKRLLFDPVFHEITETAREIKKMFDEGILKTFSVGFIIHYKRDEQGRILREGDGWPIISKYELIEISAVPVPANPNAEVIQNSIDNAKKASKEEVGGVIKWLNKTVGTTIIKPKSKNKRSVIKSLVHYARYARKFYDGKELSGDNKKEIIKTATELQAILGDVTNGGGARDKIKKGRDLKVYVEPARENVKISCDQATRKALQKIAKNANLILREIKKG